MKIHMALFLSALIAGAAAQSDPAKGKLMKFLIPFKPEAPSMSDGCNDEPWFEGEWEVEVCKQQSLTVGQALELGVGGYYYGMGEMVDMSEYEDLDEIFFIWSVYTFPPVMGFYQMIYTGCFFSGPSGPIPADEVFDCPCQLNETYEPIYVDTGDIVYNISTCEQNPIDLNQCQLGGCFTGGPGAPLVEFKIVSDGFSGGDPHLVGFNGEHADVVHNKAAENQWFSMFCNIDMHVAALFSATPAGELYITSIRVVNDDVDETVDIFGNSTMRGMVGNTNVHISRSAVSFETGSTSMKAKVNEMNKVPFFDMTYTAVGAATGVIGRTLEKRMEQEEFAQYMQYRIADDADYHVCF